MDVDFAPLDQWLEAYRRDNDLAGFAVALRGPEGPLFEKGYGVADLDSGRPIRPDTVCGIASMTKSMTGLALSLLEYEGKLRFDDPVCKYIPRFRLQGTPRQTILLEHLARHNSGLPALPTLSWCLAFHNRDNEYNAASMSRVRAEALSRVDTVSDIVEYIREYARPLGEPGQYHCYSNDAYALLSSIADLVAGEPLERYLARRVFEPLGMTRTVMDTDGSEADRIAGGNRTMLCYRTPDGLRQTPHWDCAPPYRGFGMVKSTASDMAAYYQMLAQNGAFEGRQILPAEAVDRLTGRMYPERRVPVYCVGLEKRLFRGHVVCEHSGGLTGVSSRGGFFKGEGFSAAVLCNQSEGPVLDIQNAMYNALLGLPLDASHLWADPCADKPDDPEQYAGRYDCGEGFSYAKADILCRGGLLYSRSCPENGAAPVESPLVYCGSTLFFSKPNGKALKDGRMHQFHVRDGVVLGARIAGRFYRKIN